MPTYLCHGFRWSRRSIRTLVILNDIGDAAPDWIIGPASSASILSHMYAAYDFLPNPTATAQGTRSVPAPISPKKPSGGFIGRLRKDKEKDKAKDKNVSLPPPRTVDAEDDVLRHSSTSAVKLLEEYDPADTESHSRPYAYIADYAVRIDLSVDVMDEVARYEDQATKGGSSGWLERLRDELQRGENIRWYVVSCGDEERAVPTGCEEALETEMGVTEDVGVGR